MELKTTYLGLELAHPFLPGASPLAIDLGAVRALEDAGAPAIVMHSLFEEQLLGEQLSTHAHLETPADSHAEALTYFPEPRELPLGPEEYLDQLQRIKQTVSVPVIASLNGATPGGWLEFAKFIEQAGADALELNVYRLATDLEESGEAIERHTLDMVRLVKAAIRIPVAVKLSPYYTALAHFAKNLDHAGADALVLFNRFYQADIDVDALEVKSTLRLSDSSELNLRLRWLALLAGRLDASLALTGGVHTPIDGIKAMMCGAHAVQVVSALLVHGPGHLASLRDGMAQWLEEHEYDSLAQMHGSMSLRRCPDPAAYERANYVRVLQSWRAGAARGTSSGNDEYHFRAACGAWRGDS